MAQFNHPGQAWNFIRWEAARSLKSRHGASGTEASWGVKTTEDAQHSAAAVLSASGRRQCLQRGDMASIAGVEQGVGGFGAQTRDRWVPQQKARVARGAALVLASLGSTSGRLDIRITG